MPAKPRPETEAFLADEEAVAHLAALVQSAEDAIISKSLDGTIRSWNPSAERMFGYAPSEAIGKSISMLIPPEKQGEDRHILDRIARGERVDHFETVRLHKNGTRVDVSLTVSPIKDRAGKVVGSSKIARDIGPGKRAEQALRESEARFRIMADSVPLLIWSVDARGQLQFVNAAYCAFFGKTQEDVQGLNWQALVHPDDLPAYRAAFVAALEGHAPFHAVARVRRADGEWRWVESFGHPRFSASREFLGLVGSSPDITARRQAEEALRRREGELRIIADALPVLIAYVDRHQRYRFNNLEYEKWLGHPRESLRGQHQRDALGDATFEMVRPYAESALRGEATQFEKWVDFPRAGRRYVDARYLPRRGADGEVDGFFVLVSDLTARRQAEEALRASEARERARADTLDALMEHVPTGITIADAPDATIRMISRYGRELTGRSPASLTAISYEQHPSRWGILREDGTVPAPHELPLTRAIEHGEVVRDEEWLLKRPDGKEIAVLTSAGPIRNEKGDVVGGVVAWHDISERRHVDLALRESEARLRRAQKVANLGSYEYDLVSGHAEWSPQLYEIFGLDPRTPAPSLQAVVAYIHSDDRERTQTTLDKTLRDGETFSLEVRLLAADGREKLVLSQGEVVARDPAGKPLRLLGTAMDITERSRIEAQAVRAQKLESIGLLAGGIAHDFNNLLTAIFGNIQLAKLNADDQSDIIEPLQQAERAFGRARGLTHQLLTFARGGAPARRTVSMANLLTESTSFALHGANVDVEFDIAPDLWPANVDVEQVSQAVNNLALNAREAMADGGRLRVEAKNAIVGETNVMGVKAGRYVEMCFEDTGAGIADEHVPLVFDPYFTTKPRGTGLGLTIVYSIVKRHDGQVTVQSKPGEGTRFCIYLPAGTEPVREASPTGVAISSGKGRVLLMDDEPLVQRIGKAILEKLGYEAVVAADGEEAIRLFQAAKAAGRPFSVVILDLTIPGGMGGEECLRHLRKIDPAVRAVVSSGYSTDRVVADYRAHGFVGVVPKPYKVDELSETLASLTNGRAPVA
jgi:PAS domain S-box-containing protein